ncbi:hypothetical protein GCM10017688_64810 [Streptomyces ramulosus]
MAPQCDLVRPRGDGAQVAHRPGELAAAPRRLHGLAQGAEVGCQRAQDSGVTGKVNGLDNELRKSVGWLSYAAWP